LTAGSILLEELSSKDRAKTAQWAEIANPLKYLRYTLVYHEFDRHYLPSAAPDGQILPGKFRLSSDKLDEPASLTKEMPDGPWAVRL
jgi:hypothetical protein